MTSADQAVTIVSIGTGRRRRRWLPVVAAAAAIAATVGVAVATSGGGEDGPTWGQPGPSGPSLNPPDLSWTTPHVALSARSITIDYAGRTLSPPADAVAESSVQSRGEEVMTVQWNEQDIHMTWILQFKTRDGEWWVEKMTFAEGVREGPGWTPNIDLTQDGAHAPLGQPVVGDVDLQASTGPHTARVQISGLRILAFRDRTVEAEPIDVLPADLAAPPALPADVRPTGLYGPEAEWMTVLVARDEITRECMAAAGVEYPRIPDDAIERRIDRRAAAARFGYRPGADDEPLLNGGAHGIPDNLSAEEQDAYYAAMGLVSGDGCLQQAQTALGGVQDLSPMRGWDAVIQLSGQPIEAVHSRAYGAPMVIAVVDRWRRCVYDAVGETAANPDELQRIYTYEEGAPVGGKASGHEKSVAVADFDCQQQVGWETVWNTAVVERERAAMGDRVDEYDQWVRDYQALIATAQQVLDDHGIVLPTLD